MAGLKIEGDLSQVSDQQLNYVKSVVEKLGYNNSKVTIQPLGKAGDNFVAIVKTITIEDEKGGRLNLVAKFAPTNVEMREKVYTTKVFRNEHIMYTKLLPKFTQLEIAAKIPPQERFRYAKCYGSSDDAPNEVILLEDLNDSNYKIMNRFEPLSNECIKLIMKNFAKLHSLSYVLKHKEPAFWDEIKDEFFNMWAVMDSNELVQTFSRQLQKNISDIQVLNTTGIVTTDFSHIVKLANYETNTKHAIIMQGDCWTNNVMFRFDGDNLQDCCMIDYQVSKPSSPVADIMYTVFTCTDYEQRKEHFYEWLDYYHSELDNELSNYGLKASFCYPKDQLEADLKRYGKSIFLMSLMLAGVLSMSSEDASKMKEGMAKANTEIVKQDNSFAETESKAAFRKKIEGLVDSFQEFGIL